MGDCLLLTGPVRALKEEFPEFQISVLVQPPFADCFRGNPDFHEVIIAENKLTTVARLLNQRFDLVLNLHGGPTSLFYSCVTRGKRIGGQHFQHSWLYNGVTPPPDSNVHTVQSTLAIFQWLGLQKEHSAFLRYEKQDAAATRVQRKVVQRPYVVVHPAALMATKRWDSDRFVDVGRELVRLQFTVVLTTGPGEEQIASQAAKKIPGAVTLPGLSIPELGELIRGANLYIGNDSGPMHLAAAVGTPVVAVWGSSDSRRWRPWGVDHRVVQNPFECNPCPGYRCLVADSPLCIESVTVEQVNAAVKELLETR